MAPKALAPCWTNFITTVVMLIRMTIILRLPHFVILSNRGPAAKHWVQISLFGQLLSFQTVSPLVALPKAGGTNPTTCHLIRELFF